MSRQLTKINTSRPGPASMNCRLLATTSMKLPSHPNARSRQRTAAVMLLLWLFALISGVANACLLEQPGSHAPSAATSVPASSHAVNDASGHAGSMATHSTDEELSKAPCLKACDEGSQALLKQSPPDAPCDPGAAPLVAILWVAASPGARLVRGIADPPPPLPQAPLWVLYSRWLS